MICYLDGVRACRPWDRWCLCVLGVVVVARKEPENYVVGCGKSTSHREVGSECPTLAHLKCTELVDARALSSTTRAARLTIL